MQPHRYRQSSKYWASRELRHWKTKCHLQALHQEVHKVILIAIPPDDPGNFQSE
jgi:hypothetical protein